MNEDQRREMRLLADGLATVPIDEFEMDDWKTLSNDSDCKFAACAIGWAAILIPNCGLKFEEYENRPTRKFYPVYGGRSSLNAVSLYFGISKRASEYLFLPRSYYVPGMSVQPKITPARVAERIRSFLAIPQCRPGWLRESGVSSPSPSEVPHE